MPKATRRSTCPRARPTGAASATASRSPRQRISVGDIACAEEAGGGAILTSPSAWLLHPAEAPVDQAFELRVSTPPGVAFVSGLLPPARAPPRCLRRRTRQPRRPAEPRLGGVRRAAPDPCRGRGRGDRRRRAARRRRWTRAKRRSRTGCRRRPRGARVLRPRLHPPRAGGCRPARGPRRSASRARSATAAPRSSLTSAGRRPPPDFASGWELVHELLHVSFPNLPRGAGLARGGDGHVRRAARARAPRHHPRPRGVRALPRAHALRRAGARRRGARPDPHLGADLLGRGHVLPARRRRHPRADRATGARSTTRCGRCWPRAGTCRSAGT